MSMAWCSATRSSDGPLKCLMASWTWVRPMIVTPRTPRRSAVTVSAMPDPIQSSTGSRVVLPKVITAMAGGSSAARSHGRRDVAPDGARRIDRLAVGSSSQRVDGVQVDVELARRLVAERRILGQRLQHDRVEALRHRVVEAGQRRRIGVQDAIGDVGRGARPRTAAGRSASRRARRRARTDRCARRGRGRAPAPATCR